MKRICIFLATLGCFALTFAQTSTIQIAEKTYPIDTLEHYQVGPGSIYTKYNVSISDSRNVKLYMLEIDLKNPYTKIEERNAKGVVGEYAYFTAEHAALDWENHRPIGAVNCNFYWQTTSTTEGLAGQPTGGTACNGVLVTQPDWWNMGARNTGISGWNDMGYVLIDKAGKAIMDNFQWDGKIFIGDNSYSLRDCNRFRTNPEANEIALFNHYQGSRVTRETEYEVIFKVNEWKINEDMTCEVTSVGTMGGYTIPEGQGVLQCRGNGKTFVEGLKVGDTFKMNLGIYSTNVEGFRPLIDQMTMGNALCMVAGELTQRNTNEDYNTQIYARTGMGTNDNGDKLWMLVMETTGMSTTEMCYVFKYVGATYAVGCDGGGSAQMDILGTVRNKTTTGSPRQVNNSFWAISTAPDDSSVASLSFVDFSALQISSYASYSPQVRAYNQYGWLLTSDFTDFTLTCEPASLGSISADGKTFTAGAQAGDGKLILHYGDITQEKAISIVEGKISFRLDSILTDKRDYAIEVYSSTPGKTLLVNPKFLTWQVEDESVCSIDDNGILRGLSDGCTTIYGTLDGITDSMVVCVEIPTQELLSWTDTLSYRTSNGTYEMSDGSLVFTLSSVRGAYIEYTNETPFFGCPDSVLITIKTNVPVQYTSIKMHAKGKDVQILKYEDTINTDEPHTYVIRTNDFANAADIATYPVTMDEMKVMLGSAKTKTQYYFNIEDITLCYNAEMIKSMLDEIKNTDIKTSSITIQDGNIIILNNGVRYTLTGTKL